MSVRGLRGFLSNHDGVAAVEFALIAPIMITLYFGMCEFSQVYMANKRMGHVASSVADIVARTTAVNRSQIDGIFDAGEIIMAPYPDGGLSIRVTSVTRNSQGVARIDWTRARGQHTPERARDQTVVVPPNLIANGESLIMAETAYDFESPVAYLAPESMRFAQTYYLRPRTVSRILCGDC